MRRAGAPPPTPLPAATQFCPGVSPGNARAKECLEDHRNDEGFSADCRTEIEKMIELRVGDFRLDPVLREYCEEDIDYVGYVTPLFFF